MTRFLSRTHFLNAQQNERFSYRNKKIISLSAEYMNLSMYLSVTASARPKSCCLSSEMLRPVSMSIVQKFTDQKTYKRQIGSVIFIMVERKLFAPTNDTYWSELAGTECIVSNDLLLQIFPKMATLTFRSKSRLF